MTPTFPSSSDTREGVQDTGAGRRSEWHLEQEASSISDYAVNYLPGASDGGVGGGGTHVLTGGQYAGD